MSVILSVALGIIVVVDRSSIFEKLVLDGAAMLFMALTAVALTEFRSKRQRVIGPVTSTNMSPAPGDDAQIRKSTSSQIPKKAEQYHKHGSSEAFNPLSDPH
jgi:hypothetical protein